MIGLVRNPFALHPFGNDGRRRVDGAIAGAIDFPKWSAKSPAIISNREDSVTLGL